MNFHIGNTLAASFSTSAPCQRAPREKPDSLAIRTEVTRESCATMRQNILQHPDQAASIIFNYAHESLGVAVLDASSHPMRLVATGEIWTEELQQKFHAFWMKAQQGLVKLYEAELMKGTPALEIMEKLWDYNDKLPYEFRRMAGW